MKSTKKMKTGFVISDKMDKTVVIKIDRIKTHPIYKKKYVISKNYKAHDEENTYKEGDFVEIAETKPYSKDVTYMVTRKVK
ncbi:MAG: 30S ribosomal protein S17 [Candidatus Berkelbacteria bacterium]|jgi:small subunit ribosomal protein S17